MARTVFPEALAMSPTRRSWALPVAVDSDVALITLTCTLESGRNVGVPAVLVNAGASARARLCRGFAAAGRPWKGVGPGPGRTQLIARAQDCVVRALPPAAARRRGG